MTKKYYSILIFIGLFIFFWETGAQPKILTEYQNYPIQGQTAKELHDQIKQHGHYDNGERYAGFTEWSVTWHFFYREIPNQGCGITSVSTDVKIVYLLPQWISINSAPLELKNKWIKNMEALKTHEQGHGKHALLAAQEIEQTLMRLPREIQCQSLENKANQVAKSIISKYNKEDIKYDQQTNHGATQGANILNLY